MDGCVFNIQRFSVHDGPGIRTTVFLKGCGLSCFWCHNPEGLDFKPVLQFFGELCIGCGECARVCDNALAGPCSGCGKCALACPAGARVLAGKMMSPRETAQAVLRDRDFYASHEPQKAGGATFSGGEPLMSPEFLAETMSILKNEGVSCAVETAGAVSWESFKRAEPYTDLWLFDVKHHDAEKFKEYTGGDLGRVLSNLERLSEGNTRIWIRIPLIPTVNSSPEDMRGIAAEIKRRIGAKRAERVEIMPFHRLGEGKYKSLGRSFRAQELSAPDERSVSCFKEIISGEGFSCADDTGA